MAYWAEVRNDYFEDSIDSLEGDVLARITIDAWKTSDDNEEGKVVACVMLSKRGEVLVDYHDNVARMDEMAQEAITEAKGRLKEYFMEQQKKATRGPVVPLGSSVFVSWENIDTALNNWAKEYFGSHASAEGGREENDFEINLKFLKVDDYENYVKLFEVYDKEKEYEPDDRDTLDVYDVLLTGDMAKRLFYEVFDEKVLISYGSALATYDGVFFMERERLYYDKDPLKTADSRVAEENPPLDNVLFSAQSRSNNVVADELYKADRSIDEEHLK